MGSIIPIEKSYQANSKQPIFSSEAVIQSDIEPKVRWLNSFEPCGRDRQDLVSDIELSGC